MARRNSDRSNGSQGRHSRGASGASGSRSRSSQRQSSYSSEFDLDALGLSQYASDEPFEPTNGYAGYENQSWNDNQYGQAPADNGGYYYDEPAFDGNQGGYYSDQDATQLVPSGYSPQQTEIIQQPYSGVQQYSPSATSVAPAAPKTKKELKAEKKAAKRAAKGKAPKPAKKKGKAKKIILGIFIGLLALLAAAAIAGFFYIKSINSGLNSLDSDVAEVLEPVSKMGEPFYVLILGSDSRSSGDQGRSDTIILARVDTSSRQVTLISIPRDTKVNIPGYGTNKINAAYQFGGSALAIKTVNEFAGVSISHVVEVDFSGFEDIVDALGGVTVDVPANTYYAGVSVPEGVQTLDGEQALTFARCRKTYAAGDYQRGENQRELIKAIAKQILDMDATEIPGVIKSLTKAVGTDMSVADIVSLALEMRGMDTDSIMSAVVPSAPSSEAGVSYVEVYQTQWDEMMERVKNGEDPNPDDMSDQGWGAML